MNFHKTLRKTLIGTAAAAATLGLVGPAAAASLTMTDPADTNHGVDLRRVRVSHSEQNLVVVLTHADLRRGPRSGAGGAVFIDTDPADQGPVLVFVGGYFAGTDYQLLHTNGFGRKSWGTPVEGSYRMTLDYAREKTRMRISQQALGGAQQVRVAVRVAAQRPDGSHVVDWLRRPRSYTPWVTVG